MNSAVCSILATLLLGWAEPGSPYPQAPVHPNRPAAVTSHGDAMNRLVPFRRADTSGDHADSVRQVQHAEEVPEENRRGATPDTAPSPERQGLKLPKRNLKKPDAPRKDPSTPGGAMVATVSSLAIVLGLFFLVAWLWRRNAPQGLSMLSSEAVEVLGRVQLAGKQQMHLVRVGAKLLLLSATPAGIETLTEITGPDEVNRLLGLCRRGQADSVSNSFRQVLAQLGAEPASPGFVDDGSMPDADPADREPAATRRDSWGGADA